jgi:MFS family permease
MGFFLSALFAGYAIYLPELFPTRIRCTAITFCYNTCFFVAIGSPSVLTVLTKYIYVDCDEPIRWAGATMSGIFLLGIAAVWLLPETKSKPLPE